MADNAILERLNRDPSVQRRLRFADAVVEISIGDERWAFSLCEGSVGIAGSDRSADVVIDIDPAAWALFQQAVPPPGYHDIYALAETGGAQITGDYLAFFRYSYVLKDVLQQLATGRMFG